MIGDGDCFEVAAKLVAGYGFPNARLCHGTCTGRGRIKGVEFAHAWLETIDGYGNALVVDQSNGLDVSMHLDRYYILGKCRDVSRYTRKEAREMLLKHEHYGPWHTPNQTNEQENHHGT